MSWLVEILQSYPELALFLTLAIGYAIGKIQIGSFKIGTVPGVLVTGVLVGQLGITVDNTVKAVFAFTAVNDTGKAVGGTEASSFTAVVFE